MEILDRILNAATELFRQYGFKTITMDDISRRAGISKKTLYQQFANKEEVVEATMAHFHRHTYEACAGLMAAADNAVAGLAQCSLLLDEMCCKMNPIAVLELRRFYPLVFAQVERQFLEETMQLIRQNIEQGMAEGIYREGLNASLLAQYRIAAMRLMNDSEAMLGQKYSPRELNDSIGEHFIYGLLSHKGEKIYLKHKALYQQQATEL